MSADPGVIDRFLSSSAFAVVGASEDRSKYGNKVLRCYLQHGRKAWPVNPRAAVVEGVPCSPDLASLPEPVEAVSIITPPAVSAAVLAEGLRLGIRRFWLQPGAEHRAAIEQATEAGAEVIAYGPCLLVVLGYRE